MLLSLAEGVRKTGEDWVVMTGKTGWGGVRKTGRGGSSYEMWERGREGREQVGTRKGRQRNAAGVCYDGGIGNSFYSKI